MNSLYILGAKIDDISLDEAITKIADFLNKSQKGYLTTPNPEICLQSYKSKHFRRILQNAWLNIPDGFGLKIGARIFGHKLNNTTTGVDLCQKIFELAEQNNYSVLFFEGRPKIGDRVIAVLKQKQPRLKINFIDPGRVDNLGDFENKELLTQINKYRPDITLVNLGAPKQEYFISKNINQLQTKLMLGIGGSLDFMANRLKRAPLWMRKLGLEWLWRLIQEPWRWQRIIKAVIIFPLACLWWRFGNLYIYRKNVAAFIINGKKQIFLAKHAKDNTWKLPQGGAKKSRTKADYQNAILREMKEELGTDKFEVLQMIENCNKYKWPIGSQNIDRFKGQKQTLFLLNFTGQDSDINLDLHEHTTWQWVSKVKALELAAPIRRKIIEIGLEKFKKYL